MTTSTIESPAAGPVHEGSTAGERQPEGALRSQVIRILLATDGSEHAETAEELLKLLPLAPGSAVRVAVVVDVRPEWEVPVWVRSAQQEWGEKIARQAGAALERDGVEITSVTARGAVAYEILSAAETFDADLIVVGSRGLSRVEQFLLGSVARNVAKHADRPVLVARAPRNGLREVILAVDGSEHSYQALDLLAGFPLPPEARITVVHAMRYEYPYALVGSDYAPIYDQMVREAEQARTQEARELVDSACAFLERAGRRAVPLVRQGDPAAEVLKTAGELEADLIVAGARGVSPIRGLLVGSVADRLLRQADCSVLLAR